VKAGEEYRLAMPSVLALTPDGRHALFQTPRGIAVWSVAESRELRTVPAVNIPISRIAVSPDNRTFAAVNFSGKVLVCDLESGALLREIAHGSVVHHAAFSSDGALVVTGGGGSKKDSSIKVWNSKTGELVQTLVDHQYPLATVALHDGIVAGVDMVRTVRRWELKSGMEIDSQKVNARTPFLRFASDNRWAAFVRANRLIIWDLVAKKELRGAPLPAGLSAGQAFDVTPDGRIGIVATSDNKLVFCDLVQGTAATVLSGPQKTIRSVGLTPDGRRALSTDGNRMLHIWKLDEAASQVPAAPLPTAPALKPEAKPQTKTAEWMREQKT
jgi:WD40 repeat protein